MVDQVSAPRRHGEETALDLEHVAGMLERLRARRPRVHCITNNVAQNFTANVLLALGATPSMTIAYQEIGAFAASAEAMLINLGTFDDERRKAIELVLGDRDIGRKAFVLDPVFVERSPVRLALAREVLAHGPAIVRANAGELAALAGDVEPQDFALDNKTCLALTGAVDLVTCGRRFASVALGHPLMDRVTAMGCAGSAVAAAFLAVEEDPFYAATAALTVMGAAGTLAGRECAGPGAFTMNFFDFLYNMNRQALGEAAAIETLADLKPTKEAL